MTRRSEGSRLLCLLGFAASLACAGSTGDAKPKATKGGATARAGADGKAAADAGKGPAADGAAVEDAAADTKAADTKAADGGAADSGGKADASGAVADATGGAGGDKGDGDRGTGGGGTGGKADAAGQAGADAKATAEGGSGGEVDTKALIKEIKKKRTTDERATEALAEAEAAGVEVRDLARAAYARGQALRATPDRAATFFEYARDKDPKYASPSWALAKQAVNKGELEEAKKHLVEVKKRKANKLLKQIDFDPMWEVLKDDPDVRVLLEG